MKYNININQRAAVENGFNLDIIDLAIFDFIKDFGGSANCTKVQTKEGIFFWISHKLIIQNLPLIGIKTSQGIIKRVEKLTTCKLLEKSSECEKHGKTLYRFGINYDRMLFAPLNEKLAPHQLSFSPPLNECLSYNSIIDNRDKETYSGESKNLDFNSKIYTKWTEDDLKASIMEARKKRAENPKQPNFTKELLNEFFLYWTAPHKSGKMFFRTQDKWNTLQRLISWQSRTNTNK